MAHNCYKKAFKGTKFFPQRPHWQGIKFLKFVRVDGKTPGKTMVCKQLQGIPPAGTCRERSRLVGTFGDKPRPRGSGTAGKSCAR